MTREAKILHDRRKELNLRQSDVCAEVNETAESYRYPSLRWWGNNVQKGN